MPSKKKPLFSTEKIELSLEERPPHQVFLNLVSELRTRSSLATKLANSTKSEIKRVRASLVSATWDNAADLLESAIEESKVGEWKVMRNQEKP